MQVITIETPYPVKDEEENAMHNTVVIFSSNDNFTLKQVCVNPHTHFFSLALKLAKAKVLSAEWLGWQSRRNYYRGAIP